MTHVVPRAFLDCYFAHIGWLLVLLTLLVNGSLFVWRFALRTM